ncbi:MAG: hypothetical protein KA052_02950 [Candidatus Pacebacteria bacterium]|nr:hypothetical protein [Candidatus Paceibacterota bacterium]
MPEFKTIPAQDLADAQRQFTEALLGPHWKELLARLPNFLGLKQDQPPVIISRDGFWQVIETSDSTVSKKKLTLTKNATNLLAHLTPVLTGTINLVLLKKGESIDSVISIGGKKYKIIPCTDPGAVMKRAPLLLDKSDPKQVLLLMKPCIHGLGFDDSEAVFAFDNTVDEVTVAVCEVNTIEYKNAENFICQVIPL